MSDHGWKHDALAEDLAQHLRSDQRMVWTDMQIGPAGSPRPDVYTLEKSYSKPMPTAYECKISRSDLRSDTTSGKWQKYLSFAGAVVFAVPDGLCTAADIPVGCGLIVRKAQTWRHVRKATRSAVALPMDAAMKLLIDGVGRCTGPRLPQMRHADLWRENAAVRKKFGAAVAKAAVDLTSVQTQIADLSEMRAEGFKRVDREVAARREYLIGQVRAECAEFEQAKRDLIEWLGIDGDMSAFAVRRRIVQLKAECSADARVERVEAALNRALHSVRNAADMLAPEAREGAA
ncbi:hypothetical protein [Sphingomonas sanxanigenens]|uniref:MmcB family DNA repair protein n=1 Tax=Sphingomonas sanxanigenens DSM 19645 = NX02 TaxID=1123269 RepID=W0AIC7_9SPHN|nr:hypothetical protein [Sphingomonas sanxanigenens]AHE56023.1 hypothetical protein NX02_21985 [Sphingomonas sanxanigenens DSM 19645 = NX02]